jgi:hypothetical protein
VHGQDFATAGVRHSDTLRLIDGKVSCGEAISIEGDSWKGVAKLAEPNIANLPGAPSSVDNGAPSGILVPELQRRAHSVISATSSL